MYFRAGINEVDGSKGVVTLDVLVRQVRNLHVNISCHYDIFLSHQTRRSIRDHVHQPRHNIYLPASVLAVSCHVLFCNLNLLLQRSAIDLN